MAEKRHDRCRQYLIRQQLSRHQRSIRYLGSFGPGHTDSPKTARRWSLSNLFFFLLFKITESPLILPSSFHLLPLVHPLTMASSTLATRKMAPSIMQMSSMSRRSISTSQLAGRAKPLRSTKVSQAVPRIARRSYTDAAPKPAPKPKRFKALRWAWRLTWLSAIGLTGTVAYSIFELRQPPEQSPPDPSKKTLVILGMYWMRSQIPLELKCR